MPVALMTLVAVTVRAQTPADITAPRVRAMLVGERPRRPPLTQLLVDLSIANGDAAPLWAIIPSNLPAATDANGGVNHFDQRTATANGGRVVVARLLGRGGGYALRLAPGAQVTLRHLEIGWWRRATTPSDLAFEVRLAATVTIGGQPLASWFDGEPTISGITEIDMQVAPQTHSRTAPDGRELPFVAGEVTRVLTRLVSP
jgi:hypothetical protein